MTEQVRPVQFRTKNGMDIWICSDCISAVSSVQDQSYQWEAGDSEAIKTWTVR